MDSLFILAAIAGVPVLLGLLFRVSAIYLFVSVAAGSLLVTYLGDDAGWTLGMWVKGSNSNMLAQFGLLLLPAALTLLLLRKTMPRSKMLFHVPALLATGLALAVLALPLLDSNTQAQIFANHYGNILRQSQDVAVGSAAVLVLLLMWFTGRRKEEKSKHGKHK